MQTFRIEVLLLLFACGMRRDRGPSAYITSVLQVDLYTAR